MKLTEIQIDRCGVWRNLTLPVRPNGVNVFFGPNEAGKTTLRQFIRGVLFGFTSHATDLAGSGSDRTHAAGSLHIEDAAGNHRIHRAAVGDLAGDARLITGDVAAPVHGAALFGETHEQLFDRIFALNLRELSEINSLSGDDVSRHVFGLSFGPRGARLVNAARQIDERRTELIDPLHHQGELVALFDQHDRLKQRLAELDPLRDRHAEWCLRRDQLEREISGLRLRHAGTSAQLRGHAFMERAWGPWNRARECRQELESLREISHFPERGVERLDRIESELATAAEQRDRLLAEVRRIKHDLLNPAGDAGWRTHSGALRGFVEQRGWLVALEQRREAALREADARELELQVACDRLGVDWTAARVDAADASPATERRLSGVAESFRSAVARRQTAERKCRRMKRACRELKDALAESLHDLGEMTIDAALAQARSRITELNKLASVKLRELELSQKLAGIEHERNRTAPQLTLPAWVHVVLGVFAFMGVILAGWGLVAGVVTSGIAGAIYAMLGITCGGLAWGLKIQYEGEARKRLGDVDAIAAALTHEITALQTMILRANGGKTIGETSDLIVEAQQHIADLVELGSRQQRLRAFRRRLAGLKKRLHTSNLEVGTARQSWNDLLQKIGIPNTLSIDEALAAWQLLVVAAERLEEWKHSGRELSLVDGIRKEYRQRILELARRLPEMPGENRDPLDVLSDWEARLALLDRGLTTRHELKTRLKHKRREVAEARQRVADIKVKRNAMLVQAGAANRDEFEERARSFARRTFLRDQLQDAERDLDAICATHTDLALVEEDLERFDAVHNSECITTLRMELADLDGDLERAFEHLAGVKREIEALENDTRATHVRFELRQIEARLRTLAREWVVCEAASRTIDDLRRDFERTHQPLALAEAGRMFSRLTGGKYSRVWSPLGERRLVVSDDQGHSFPVQSLSRATREQLLLAVRLAVVRELARQGTTLPMILDDVFVNFDEQRARAAVDLLVELGEQGQQVLFFTCHNHLAQLFAERGIESTRLPSHPASAAMGHDETRMAG
jgi:uncharacterized protein YhaN